MMNYQLKSRQVRVVIDENFGIFDSQLRFDICDEAGKVIDDAQGYGYKSAQSAHKAASYKFKGGKQKADAAKVLAKAFWRQNKSFAAQLSDMLLCSIKEPPSDPELIAFAIECGVANFDPRFVKEMP
jgi:hypothetical protein